MDQAQNVCASMPGASRQTLCYSAHTVYLNNVYWLPVQIDAAASRAVLKS